MDHVRDTMGHNYEDPILTSNPKKSVTFLLEESADTTFSDQGENQTEQLIAADVHQNPPETDQPPPLPQKSPKKNKPVGISVPLTTRPRLLKKSKKQDKSGYMEMKAISPPKKPPRVEPISTTSPVLEPLLAE